MPEDYKRIVEHTGGAYMGCCLLRNPAERTNMYVTLSVAALHREHILWNEMTMERMGVSWFPESEGLIQLAMVNRTFFMLSSDGDTIVICDCGSWETFGSNLSFSELMWSLFQDRNQLDGLGDAIWRHSKRLFGLPGREKC